MRRELPQCPVTVAGHKIAKPTVCTSHKDSVNVEFQQDFNVRGLSWFSSVVWRCDLFGPVEYAPAGRNINSC
jgi:hypothetical protein